MEVLLLLQVLFIAVFSGKQSHGLVVLRGMHLSLLQKAISLQAFMAHSARMFTGSS